MHRRDRFVSNLRNLAGGFITSYRVKMLEFDTKTDTPAEDGLVALKSRLRVNLELGLPWRPTLGWVRLSGGGGGERGGEPNTNYIYIYIT